MFSQLYLVLIWEKENNTITILISLFINSIRKKGRKKESGVTKTR